MSFISGGRIKAITRYAEKNFFSLPVLLIFTILFCFRHFRDDVIYFEAIDSESYMDSFELLLNGQFDIFRTPVYPLIYGALTHFTGVHLGSILTVLIQVLLCFITLCAVWRMFMDMGVGKKFAFCVLFFGICVNPMVETENFATISESLSVSLFGLISVSFYYAYKKGRRSSIILTAVLTLVAIGLRPGNLLLLPIMLLVCGWLAFRKREKIWCIGIIAFSIVGVAELAYTLKAKEEMGVFSPTLVSVVNNYGCARGGGYLDASFVQDEALRTNLKDSINIHGEILGYDMNWKDWGNVMNERRMLGEKIGWKGVNDLVGSSIKAHPVAYCRTVIGRFKSIGSSDFSWVIKTFYIYYFLIYFGLKFIWYKIKGREIDMLLYKVLMLSIIVGNFLTVAISGPNDFPRLTLGAVYPLVIFIGTLGAIRKNNSPARS